MDVTARKYMVQSLVEPHFDFQKVFDKVPNKNLVNKVRGQGIKDTSLTLVENWLSERMHSMGMSMSFSD